MKQEKYAVDVVHDGETGLEYAKSGLYDVIILDIMLPRKNGYEVVKELRSAKIITPVLLLTEKDDITDKVNGLDYGADDYMTKPFVPEELMARIRALSRRHGEVVLEELSFADLTLNLATYTLTRGPKSVRLGYKEYEF
jgi:DNA-binding response OmpR family regulator